MRWRNVVVGSAIEMLPFRCGAELLIERFRSECFQLDARVDDWGLFGPPRASEYRWPEHECWTVGIDKYPTRFRREVQGQWHEWWPHLCTGWEVLPTATYDGRATLGLCWQEQEP